MSLSYLEYITDSLNTFNLIFFPNLNLSTSIATMNFNSIQFICIIWPPAQNTYNSI